MLVLLLLFFKLTFLLELGCKSRSTLSLLSSNVFRSLCRFTGKLRNWVLRIMSGMVFTVLNNVEYLSWLIGKTNKKSLCNLSFTWDWVPNCILLPLFFPCFSLCTHFSLHPYLWIQQLVVRWVVLSSVWHAHWASWGRTLSSGMVVSAVPRGYEWFGPRW